MTGEPDPQWLREAARAFAHEWAEYFRTSWAVARAPRRFAADWADGRRDDLNPILFTLNMLAIQTPWVVVCNRLFGQADVSYPLWSQALAGIAEFTSILLWVLPLAALIWLLGGRRPLRSTYGIALYALCGPVTLLTMPLYPFFARYRTGGAHMGVAAALLAMVLLVYIFVVWVWYVSLAAAGLHRIRARGIAAAAVLLMIGYFVFYYWVQKYHPALGHALSGAT